MKNFKEIFLNLKNAISEIDADFWKEVEELLNKSNGQEQETSRNESRENADEKQTQDAIKWEGHQPSKHLKATINEKILLLDKALTDLKALELERSEEEEQKNNILIEQKNNIEKLSASEQLLLKSDREKDDLMKKLGMRVSELKSVENNLNNRIQEIEDQSRTRLNDLTAEKENLSNSLKDYENLTNKLKEENKQLELSHKESTGKLESNLKTIADLTNKIEGLE